MLCVEMGMNIDEQTKNQTAASAEDGAKPAVNTPVTDLLEDKNFEGGRAKKNEKSEKEKDVAREQPFDPRTSMDNSNRRVLSREVYYKGQTIIEQGTEGYRAYFIERGKVEILIKDGPHQLKIAEMVAGDLFGEMSLITHEPRSATVRAVEDTVLTIISKDEIESKIGTIKDKAIRALINVLAARLRNSTQGQLTQYKSLAEFQDRVTGIVDSVEQGIDADQRAAFSDEVSPLLNDLQKILDKYRG
jgi:CRP/FNR family transcriptional regulator, cyclic AMP receptor protein